MTLTDSIPVIILNTNEFFYVSVLAIVLKNCLWWRLNQFHWTQCPHCTSENLIEHLLPVHQVILPYITQQKQCVLTYPQNYNIFVFFLFAWSGNNNALKAVGLMCVRTLQWPPTSIAAHLGWCALCAALLITLDMNCDFSSNNNICARFYEFFWRPFWIWLGYFYYDRLIGISRLSFLAAILNCNFRLLTSGCKF